MQPRITTLVYAIHDGHVALLQRAKEPNHGLWSAPGGKLEPGESPLDGALRELAEETGLVGTSPRLCAVVSELDPLRGEAWLMFVFRVAVSDPTLSTATHEGHVTWVPLDDVPALPQPAADWYILAAVLEGQPGVAFLTARYEDGRLLDVAVARSAGPV